MLKSVRVRDYMLTRPVTVSPDTDIFEAIHQILVNKISGVTVVDDDNRPVGILSELDCAGHSLGDAYSQQRRRPPMRARSAGSSSRATMRCASARWSPTGTR